MVDLLRLFVLPWLVLFGGYTLYCTAIWIGLWLGLLDAVNPETGKKYETWVLCYNALSGLGIVSVMLVIALYLITLDAMQVIQIAGILLAAVVIPVAFGLFIFRTVNEWERKR